MHYVPCTQALSDFRRTGIFHLKFIKDKGTRRMDGRKQGGTSGNIGDLFWIGRGNLSPMAKALWLEVAKAVRKEL